MDELKNVLSIIQKSESSWNNVDEDSCKMVKLVGNSNKVYMVETSLAITPKRFIFRIFDDGETQDHYSVSRIFHRLAQNCIAPKIYTETEKYRLEEFLDGTRNLQHEEFLQPKIIIKKNKIGPRKRPIVFLLICILSNIAKLN